MLNFAKESHRRHPQMRELRGCDNRKKLFRKQILPIHPQQRSEEGHKTQNHRSSIANPYFK